MSGQATITISAEDGAALLDYLDQVEFIDDYDEWDGVRRRLHLAVFGEELPPRPEQPPPTPEEIERLRKWAAWSNALQPRLTPLLATIGDGSVLGPAPNGTKFFWRHEKAPAE